LARPDIVKPIGDLATQVQKWSKNCDKALYRLICYIQSTLEHRLTGTVGDCSAALRLRLYVDADFAGDRLDSKSTSGGFLVLYGPNTFFPLAWICKKQTAVSRSTTEAEVISLAYSLFSEALPTMQLWCQILGRDMHLEVLEDNEATIKIIRKSGSAKLRHVSRTHKINLASVYEQFKDPCISLQYVNTKEQAADIFTKALPPQSWDHALRLMGMLQPAQRSSISGSTRGDAPVAPTIAAPCPACSAALVAPERIARAKGGDDPYFQSSTNQGVTSWDAPHQAEVPDAPAAMRDNDVNLHTLTFKCEKRDGLGIVQMCARDSRSACSAGCCAPPCTGKESACRHERGELRNPEDFSCKSS
jgi:hypothetical protein